MQVVNYNYGIFSSHYTGVPTYFYIYVYVCSRRTWKPTPIFLPAESHGQRNLQDYGLWGHKVSDTTARLSIPQTTLKGFPGGSGGKQSVCNAEGEDSIPGLDR